MEIKQAINPKDYEVGVIVGRFQTDELHEGHINFIDEVFENHKKVIILLGVSRVQNTRKNPLDFASRKAMIQAEFPSVMILPIQDQRYNEKWSHDVDAIIPIPFGEKKTVIYGSRDSFIPYYSGKFPVIELEESVTYNGTNIREEVAKETLDSDDFRSGVIYSSFNHRPTTFPTVDIVAHDSEGNILLGRKPNEKLFRFVGGFVDTSDSSFEVAALRELNEETGGNLVVDRNLTYITSQKVNDWRYKGEDSGIMTTLYLATRKFGFAKASDDIAEIKWVPANKFSNYDGIRTGIVPEHRELMKTFIDKVYSENLIPIGEKLEERTNVTYTIE
jgi:bifunctional NMN adenylyltransferase/nudix hydrolase